MDEPVPGEDEMLSGRQSEKLRLRRAAKVGKKPTCGDLVKTIYSIL